MSTKFTGTPWETSTYCDDHGNTVWDVCEVDGGDMVADVGSGDEAERRANLIAAAPELLEALHKILTLAGDFESKAIARAAIAKAEGGVS